MPCRSDLNIACRHKNDENGCVIGYSGTLKGLVVCGYFFLRMKRLIPVNKKKNQKTGAVKSTIDSKLFV